MPTYAVLLQYEVVSGLVIEAADSDEAAKLASEFEAAAHEAIADGGAVRVSSRLWGDGTIEVEEADSDDDAEDMLDEWIEELDDDEDDSDDDDSDEDDDEDDSDEDDEDDDATDELDEQPNDDDVDPDGEGEDRR